MTDEQTLFVVLVAIYASDCLLWLPKDAIAFVAWWGRSWKWKILSQYLGTSKGGLLLLNMLPPFGNVICSYTLPLSISPAGICHFASQTLPGSTRQEHGGKVVLFKSMKTVMRRNRDLIINDSLFCKFYSNEQAQLIEALLNALLQGSDQKRHSYLEQFWQKQFDLKRAHRVFKSIWPQFNTLRGLCVSHFVFLFALVPITTYFYGLPKILIGTIIMIFLMATIIAYEFFRLHKKFYPSDSEDRISKVVMMILCPPISIRACDHFAKSLMIKFHSLATAHACLAKPQFFDFASMILRDMFFPIPFHLDEPHAMEICQWHNSFVFSIAKRALQHEPKLIDRLTKPPNRDDETILTYCPRCLCQFQLIQGTCSSCPGIKLKPFVESMLSHSNEGK